ncbi:MAG: nucleotide exchange factor GrpE [Reichenbachiella sp.]
MAKSKKQADNKSQEAEVQEEVVNQEDQTEQEAQAEEKEQVIEELSTEEKLQAELKESQDKYLRLYSEFENFRRRTSKEKLELISNAGEGVIQSFLPVVDDFERAYKSMGEDADVKSIKEGVDLVFTKLQGILEAKGVKAISPKPGSEFDLELHEAITQIPAPEKKLIGKVVDCVEKGYQLNDKVIRFAKVVTGS